MYTLLLTSHYPFNKPILTYYSGINLSECLYHIAKRMITMEEVLDHKSAYYDDDELMQRADEFYEEYVRQYATTLNINVLEPFNYAEGATGSHLAILIEEK